MSMNEKWINKTWHIHTMKYYSVIKRNETLTPAATWMNLENIMLSERNQSRKATYCMNPFMRNVQNRQIHTDTK